jgi:hypothetical protein
MRMGFDSHNTPPGSQPQPSGAGYYPGQPLTSPQPPVWAPPPPTTFPPPLMAPPPSVRPRFWRSPLFIALAIGASALLLVSIVGGAFLVLRGVLHHTDGYLYTDSTNVAFVQWTEDASKHVTGTLQEAWVGDNNTVQSDSLSFTGVRDNGQLSLTFPTGVTVTANLQGDTLTLAIPTQAGTLSPTVFHAASIQDYNDAVNALRQHVGQTVATQAIVAATVTAQASSDQAVANANSTLSSALSRLESDKQTLKSDTDFRSELDDYASDWATMQQDYQTEQNDAAGGCSNYGSVQFDAGTVQFDLGTIQFDASSLKSQVDTVNRDRSAVQSDIGDVKATWQALQAAVQADPGQTAAFSQADIDGAVASAQSQIDVSAKAVSDAQASGKAYDQKAVNKNAAAQQLVNQMSC